VGGTEGEVVLEERLDVQGPVSDHAEHEQFVRAIGDRLGAVNMPQAEAEDQWSNVEFGNPASHRADALELCGEAPELVGVTYPADQEAPPRRAHVLGCPWPSHETTEYPGAGVPERGAPLTVPHVPRLYASWALRRPST
jgi:hypothetical protein